MAATLHPLRPELAAAAGYLGLPRDRLYVLLRAGATLSGLARERDRTVGGLVVTMVATAGAQLEAAIAAEALTPPERDEMLADLRDRIEDAVERPIPFSAAA